MSGHTAYRNQNGKLLTDRILRLGWMKRKAVRSRCCPSSVAPKVGRKSCPRKSFGYSKLGSRGLCGSNEMSCVHPTKQTQFLPKKVFWSFFFSLPFRLDSTSRQGTFWYGQILYCIPLLAMVIFPFAAGAGISQVAQTRMAAPWQSLWVPANRFLVSLLAPTRKGRTP